jgi:hypothetical protein
MRSPWDRAGVSLGCVGLADSDCVSPPYSRHRLNNIFGFAVDAVLTLGLTISIVLLVAALPHTWNRPERFYFLPHPVDHQYFVFALWYWRLDAGGPHQRDQRAEHTDGAFLFPQMTMSEQALRYAGIENWSPVFVDYLFLAFNTSTAFSPTDVPVLTRWAKF